MTHHGRSVDADIDAYLAELTSDVRTALLGASVRGDREALEVATRNAAALCEISEHRALAAWVQCLFDGGQDVGPSSFELEELEKLPGEALLGFAFQLARVQFAGGTSGSSVSSRIN